MQIRAWLLCSVLVGVFACATTSDDRAPSDEATVSSADDDAVTDSFAPPERAIMTPERVKALLGAASTNDPKAMELAVAASGGCPAPNVCDSSYGSPTAWSNEMGCGGPYCSASHCPRTAGYRNVQDVYQYQLVFNAAGQSCTNIIVRTLGAWGCGCRESDPGDL